MSGKTTHNKKSGNENADNMSQNEGTDEALSNVLNVDDSRAGSELSESNDGEVEKMAAELAEIKDKHLRLVAEFDNFRRRNAKERIELVQTAGKDIIESLLVVLDDVDRASKQLETTTDIQILKEGVSLVFNKLRLIMQQKGLRVMEAMNEDFNPDLHEAITEIPAPTEEMKGKVIDVVEAGYYLNDKLIRHAKVVVGK
ncbi:MAG: nucleotide exchange factor GrpE [Chitinophagales bacterium]